MSSALAKKDVNTRIQGQDAGVVKNSAAKVNGVKDSTVKDAAVEDKDSSKLASAKSLEYHRQVLQSKMEEEKYGATAYTTTYPVTTSSFAPAAPPAHLLKPRANPVTNIDAAADRKQQYISPSDNIMSPCTAKLNALKGRAAGRIKPKSLFAQTSAKNFDDKNPFGAPQAKSALGDKPDSPPKPDGPPEPAT
ncbi:hypothetical protein GGR54DRAFT_42265 [Hypoxylon sp. NC1633]|nr:hypothetical protein GGR54DRAFT_42265 [Hypoxylon sp. NC1633]